MNSDTADQARAVLEFWFGRGPHTAEAMKRRMSLWFGSADEHPEAQQLDQTIRDRFSDTMRRAAEGDLDHWASTPRRRLALILLLDQFPRNVFRGTARAMAQDSKALALTEEGLQLGADGALDPAERMFFYMPLQHAESREAQEQSTMLFRRLLEEAPAGMHELLAASLEYANKHRDLVERFGRFPHRNRALGRASTPAEIRYLREGGETFGQ